MLQGSVAKGPPKTEKQRERESESCLFLRRINQPGFAGQPDVSNGAHVQPGGSARSRAKILGVGLSNLGSRKFVRHPEDYSKDLIRDLNLESYPYRSGCAGSGREDSRTKGGMANSESQ